MFKEGTLFIVGAGAGVEADMPTGPDLMAIISQKLNFYIDRFENEYRGDLEILDAIKVRFRGDSEAIDLHFKAGRKIANGLAGAISIDNYMHTHSTNPQVQICGKLAIAKSILEAEKRSKLSLPQGSIELDLSASWLNEAWYKPFSRKLMAGYQTEDVQSVFENVSVICFNYDRCIEHYLRFALSSYFGITRERAQELVETLSIVHPYGTVGELWNASSLPTVEYGQVLQLDSLVRAAERIRIFTEDQSDNKEIAKAKQLFAQAKHIVFLGFGYLDQNLEVLRTSFDANYTRKESIRGTAYGISDSDVGEIVIKLGELTKAKHTKMKIHNSKTTSELFKEHDIGM